ncbi:hypothetical protein C8R42DRAFT_664516 [Lentinula raphanica]|nr:hypothetical protein C8R42DRAFT_664516 [Lentinula raphanica]
MDPIHNPNNNHAETEHDHDQAFFALPEDLQRRIDHAFALGAEDPERSLNGREDPDERPSKRRKLGGQAQGLDIDPNSEMTDTGGGGGFLLPDTTAHDEGGGGGGGGFIIDDPELLPEETENKQPQAQPNLDSHSSSYSYIRLLSIPTALADLGLPPDDERILSVFRNAAGGWGDGDEGKGKGKAAAKDEDSKIGVSLADWRAVCAILLEPGGGGGGFEEMDVDVIDVDAEQDDEDVGVEEADDNDGDYEPATTSRLTRSKTKTQTNSTPRSTTTTAPTRTRLGRTKPRYASDSDPDEDEDSDDSFVDDDDDSFVKVRRTRTTKSTTKSTKSTKPTKKPSKTIPDQAHLGPNEKTICLQAFNLFFVDRASPTQGASLHPELERRRLGIAEIRRVAEVLGEKLKVEEMVEMLEVFSDRQDKTMGLEDFERMMVRAGLV